MATARFTIATTISVALAFGAVHLSGWAGTLTTSRCSGSDAETQGLSIVADDESPGDDDTGGGDYWERAGCGGYAYPECDTAVNVPPQLDSVAVWVDGQVMDTPVTLAPSARVELALEFVFPGSVLCVGHVFVIRNGEPTCLDEDGTAVEGSGPEIPSICSTYETGKPYRIRVDPKFFLNGKGAPYGVEISNECGTHSNRLPLDIITRSGDEGDGGESEGCGCGG